VSAVICAPAAAIAGYQLQFAWLWSGTALAPRCVEAVWKYGIDSPFTMIGRTGSGAWAL